MELLILIIEMYCLQWKGGHPGIYKEPCPGPSVPNQGTGGMGELDFGIAMDE